MAIVIDVPLMADPAATRLPSEVIRLQQKVHSDFGEDEQATITYKLDGRTNVHFKTTKGAVKTIELTVDIPGEETLRTDEVELAETGGGTSMAQVEIQQTIKAENTSLDAVVIAILT